MSKVDPLALEVYEDAELYDLKRDESDGAVWVHQDLAQVKIKVFKGHKDCVSTCTFCDDDTKILTGSWDKSVVLWDIDAGRALKAYNGHSRYIAKVRRDPTSTMFASAGWDKKVICWKIETGTKLWTGNHGGVVLCCNFSHDGKYLVTGSDLEYEAKIWDVYTGKCIRTIENLHKSTITSCQFSPKDDRIITTSMDKTTKFYDLKACKTTITLQGHRNIIADASISKDERKIATVGWDKAVKIWDASTGMFRSLGPDKIEKAHEGSISSCQVSNDSQWLVTGSYDKSVGVWDLNTGISKLRLVGHTNWVEDVGMSQGGGFVVSASRDKTVRLWDIQKSDAIPAVMEKKKTVGYKVTACSSCGKPFSAAQNPDMTSKECVFCRVQSQNRTYGSIDLNEVKDQV